MRNKLLLEELRKVPADTAVELYAPSAGPGIGSFNDHICAVDTNNAVLVAASVYKPALTAGDIVTLLNRVHDEANVNVLIPEFTTLDAFDIIDVFRVCYPGDADNDPSDYIVIEVEL